MSIITAAKNQILNRVFSRLGHSVVITFELSEFHW